jgi:hypothetical protein
VLINSLENQFHPRTWRSSCSSLESRVSSRRHFWRAYQAISLRFRHVCQKNIANVRKKNVGLVAHFFGQLVTVYCFQMSRSYVRRVRIPLRTRLFFVYRWRLRGLRTVVIVVFDPRSLVHIPTIRAHIFRFQNHSVGYYSYLTFNGMWRTIVVWALFVTFAAPAHTWTQQLFIAGCVIRIFRFQKQSVRTTARVSHLAAISRSLLRWRIVFDIKYLPVLGLRLAHDLVIDVLTCHTLALAQLAPYVAAICVRLNCVADDPWHGSLGRFTATWTSCFRFWKIFVPVFVPCNMFILSLKMC